MRAIWVAGLAATPASLGVEWHWWWLTALMVVPYAWGIRELWRYRR